MNGYSFFAPTMPQRGRAPLWWFLQMWWPVSLLCLNL